jgi:drug/metabolite transporter (DMT)-like permease
MGTFAGSFLAARMSTRFLKGFFVVFLYYVAWQMLAGVLPLTIVPLGMDLPSTRWSAMQALYLLYIGAVSTAGGFILWIAVLSRLPAGTASLNMFAIPVIALVTSMIVFGERLAANEWLGIAAIGVGLAILSWRAFVGMRGVPETAPR